MTKNIITLFAVASLGLFSCGTSEDKKAEVISKPEAVAADQIVTSTAIDKNGKRLEMTFNNTKDIALVALNGEKIELSGQKPASGILYKNNNYELSGKGAQVALKKDGKVIFESVSSIIYGEKHLFVAAETQNCSAGVMKKDCLQVKYDKDQKNWELFYDTIEGFQYEKGYNYELIVLDERVDNPPADGSSIKYRLIKEVSKTKATK
ncbi:hypothetical protein DBR32_07925 [Taibaiella sp. KBW10]|uniref:DUF4377 domain-containing protein n=1 Tax=Taibaiella sp. KBW10 TaxID=2153357 RepID=UPI000F597E04|nr:DUF4377 domain-containing protein [Taibaiella sp. KBW10]RQO30653.1 hypothetical protein DBR32_07925 [Taibaiella sp. KBW10]